MISATKMAKNIYVKQVLILFFAAFCATGIAARAQAPAPVQGDTQGLRPRTIADIAELLDQYKPDPAKEAAAREALARTLPENASRGDQIRFHSERAVLADSLGMTGVLLESKRKLVELTKGDVTHARHLAELSSNESQAGNHLESIRLRELVLKEVHVNPGQEMSSYYLLARSFAWIGEVGTARAHVARGDAILERIRNGPRSGPYVPLWTANREWAQADIAQATGRWVEAEAAQRRSVQAFARYLESAERLARSEPNAPSPESIRGAMAYAEMGLARHLIWLGRTAEAEITLRTVLRRLLTENGKYTPRTGVALARFAEVLGAQGRWRETLTIADAATDVFDRSGVASSSIFRMAATAQRGVAYFGMGQWREAREAWAQLRTAAARDSISARSFRGSPVEVASFLKGGDVAYARGASEALLQDLEKNFGPNHMRTAIVRGLNAMALAAQGERDRALEGFSAAVRVILGSHNDPDRFSALTRRLQNMVLESYIGLLYELRDSDVLRLRKVDAATESFRVADALRGGSVQQSLAASAARAAANQPGLGDLIRKEQDLRQEVASLYDFLLRMMSTPPEQQLPKVISDMKARIEAIGKERTQLSADIVKRFPEYANLINPRPASLDDARKALRAGESLVSVLTTEEYSFAWALDAQGKVAFHAAKLGEKELGAMVAKLRRALDPGDADVIPPYDLATAHRLYKALLEPLAPVWGGAQTMVVVASGALGQLPLSVLPTTATVPAKDNRQLYGEYRQVDWLARKVAVAYAPSVTAFARLRALPAASAQRSPFAGFGDPVFGGKQVVASNTSTRGIRLRNLQISRVTEQTAVTTAASSAWPEYAQLTPLPDTRDEINAIATALGANPQTDVFLGPDASRQKVRQTDLSRRRIVAFATHGLIPGDLPELDQPALALSVTADGKESPLLTLEDVLGLKLDADWVVLSACNTAAGDGQGAEAVSGLGRGFFYAGTRALLVTHWPVETVSARLLTTGIFERYAKGATGRAQALNASMVALIDSPGTQQFSYAHPLFWAPYALIGDAGR